LPPIDSCFICRSRNGWCNRSGKQTSNYSPIVSRTTGSQTGASSTVPSAGGTVSQNNGYVPDDSTGIDAQVKRIQQSKQSNPSTNPVKVIPTNFGIVADDDSTSYASTTQAGVAAITPKTGAASNIRPPALTPGGRIRIRGNPLDIQPI
jgi:hypothetical protein